MQSEGDDLGEWTFGIIRRLHHRGLTKIPGPRVSYKTVKSESCHKANHWLRLWTKQQLLPKCLPVLPTLKTWQYKYWSERNCRHTTICGDSFQSSNKVRGTKLFTTTPIKAGHWSTPSASYSTPLLSHSMKFNINITFASKSLSFQFSD
jgi:hypothetical protein